MNALQAIQRLETLKTRADALARVVYYFDGDAEWSAERAEFKTMLANTEREINSINEKLSEVRI